MKILILIMLLALSACGTATYRMKNCKPEGYDGGDRLYECEAYNSGAPIGRMR